MPYSTSTQQGNGVTTNFVIPFSFIYRAHVRVYVGGVENTTFTWVNSTTIQITPPPPIGVNNVYIKRVTPISATLTTFIDGSVLFATDLTTGQLQTLFLAQEGDDAAINSTTSAAAALASQNAASVSATAAAGSASTATTQASVAANSASTATTQANAASASATAAANSASTATTQANAASASATAAANSASTATTQANAASGSASTATAKAAEATLISATISNIGHYLDLDLITIVATSPPTDYGSL